MELDKVRMVVGLGNPGEEYKDTRHNVGFAVLDRLAVRGRVRFKRNWRTRARVGQMQVSGESLLLVKPQTYMNRSGQAVAALLRRYHLAPEDIIVVVDDAELEPGALRIRKQGGPGHHNGLKSIVADLGTEKFARLRVGVGGRPEEVDMVEHVLSRFEEEERAVMERSVNTAAEALVCIVRDGIDQAMNRFN